MYFEIRYLKELQHVMLLADLINGFALLRPPTVMLFVYHEQHISIIYMYDLPLCGCECGLFTIVCIYLAYKVRQIISTIKRIIG